MFDFIKKTANDVAIQVAKDKDVKLFAGATVQLAKGTVASVREGNGTDAMEYGLATGMAAGIAGLAGVNALIK